MLFAGPAERLLELLEAIMRLLDDIGLQNSSVVGRKFLGAGKTLGRLLRPADRTG